MVRSSVGVDRRIPRWASGILAMMAADRPSVVTRDDIAAYLAECRAERDVERTTRQLQELGWLAALHLKGVWAYLPPGVDEVVDPYVDLRAWQARDPDARFALAGEAAAWHLGYLDRDPGAPVAVWVPPGERVPHGLRAHVSLVRVRWDGAAGRLFGPTPALLRRRGLDLTGWASGLPAFGPEGLVVQLAARPSSFRAWADLAVHLDGLAGDCDPGRLVKLLAGQSSSTWQRAAYLLYLGHQPGGAEAVLAGRPPGSMPNALFAGPGPAKVWSPQFNVTDRLVAPLVDLVGKA
jgi:hypothetical protein